MSSLNRARPAAAPAAPPTSGEPQVEQSTARRSLSRRGFLVGLGGATAAAFIGRSLLDGSPTGPGQAVANAAPTRNWGLVASDGWVSMPEAAKAIPPFWPDTLGGVDATDLYTFGFRRADQAWTDSAFKFEELKNQAQISGPLLFCDVGDDVRVKLFNAGLGNRPDLGDSHTFHWHGFSNQVPYFDGVPDDSFSVPVGGNAIYRFLPTEPGTYMYHCHFEDVEHVQMGMTGMIFVRPKGAPMQAYDDPATSFNRQFGLLLTEVDVRAHYNDSHLQTSNWTDYTPTFALMNGRAYPDTLAPSLDPDAQPALAPNDPLYRLRFQPMSSVVEAKAGEKVLLRIANLGFAEHSLELAGLQMRVVGADARGLTGARTNLNDFSNNPSGPRRGDASWWTNRLDLGPGESRDVLIDTSSVTVPSGQVVEFPLFDRNAAFTSAADGQPDGSAGARYGGMRTVVRVHPANAPLGPQTDAALAFNKASE
jgi:FtsP/CotA-like multicopper oxidase with cupredoxin domain